MIANHAPPELERLVNRQAELFNRDAPESEKVAIYLEIVKVQQEIKKNETNKKI